MGEASVLEIPGKEGGDGSFVVNPDGIGPQIMGSG